MTSLGFALQDKIFLASIKVSAHIQNSKLKTIIFVLAVIRCTTQLPIPTSSSLVIQRYSRSLLAT